MNYIIFDLEWNNAYNYKTKKGVNEIVEIGAVKLNDSFETIDTFKQLIKPIISKKLGTSFQKLTHITMEEINADGISFNDAFDNFSRWCGNDESVFMSWSMSDLYTLVENYKRIKNSANIDFIKKYADAQSYCMHFIDNDKGNQISLSHCAERFEIEFDTSVLHRALDDCFLTAGCIKKVFDRDLFSSYIKDCDVSFFERLVFKPYCLSFKDGFDPSQVEVVCPNCAGRVRILDDYEFNAGAFKSKGICRKCRKKFWVNIRAKQNYDDVSVSQRLVPMSKKRAKFVK